MATEYDAAAFWQQPDADEAFVRLLGEWVGGQEGCVAAGEGEVFGEVLEGGFEAPLPSLPSPIPPPPPPPPPPLSAPAPTPFLASAAALAPSPSGSADSAVDLRASLDDAGLDALNALLCAPASPPYTPEAHILADNPAAAHDPNALYHPITTSSFRGAEEAAAHRRRARVAPKNRAADVARVKALGRDYWVCRLFNAMINSANITDSESSIHRTRFTTKPAFDAVDLEAAAHAVFDEAIAVHERGWNRPKVYHKQAVRGKLVDIAQTSVELRLSRICLVLQQTKSAVDDAVRGGVTLALLCDNPEARLFTKRANDAGNAKKGERLRETATKEKAKAKEEKKPRKEKKEKKGESKAEVEVQVEVEEQNVVESFVEGVAEAAEMKVEELEQDIGDNIAEDVDEVGEVAMDDEWAEFFNFEE